MTFITALMAVITFYLHDMTSLKWQSADAFSIAATYMMSYCPHVNTLPDNNKQRKSIYTNHTQKPQLLYHIISMH